MLHLGNCGARRCNFRLEISHTVFDGVSWSIVMQDLQSLYHNDQLEQAPSLTRISASKNATSDDANGYWALYLSEVDECNIPRSAEPTLSKTEAQWGSSTLTFDMARLSGFCRTVAVTIPNLLQTAWALTLGRIVAKDEVCFGYLVSNRLNANDTYDAETIGCGLAMFVQRTSLAHATSIKDLLHRVRDDCAEHITQPRNSPPLSYHCPGKQGERRFNSMVNVRMFAEQSRESNETALTKRERLKFEEIDGQDPWDVCFHIFLVHFLFVSLFDDRVGRDELMTP